MVLLGRCWELLLVRIMKVGENFSHESENNFLLTILSERADRKHLHKLQSALEIVTVDPNLVSSNISPAQFFIYWRTFADLLCLRVSRVWNIFSSLDTILTSSYSILRSDTDSPHITSLQPPILQYAVLHWSCYYPDTSPAHCPETSPAVPQAAYPDPQTIPVSLLASVMYRRPVQSARLCLVLAH